MKVWELKRGVEYIRKQIICYIIFLLMIFTTSYSIGKYHSLFTKYTTLQLDLQSQVDITKSLEEYKENLLDINEELADKYNTEVLDGINKSFNYIEPLRLYDKQAYIIAYTNIIEDLEDPPESPQDVMSDEEYDMFCRIVEAEIGNGNFDQKCNVASAIINRYDSEFFPDSWMECFMQKSNGTYQFSSVGDGRYKTVTVSESTINAINYSFMIEDTAQGCTYFRSGTSDTWHDTSNNLDMVFKDGKHTYYKLKGDN